MILPSLSRRLVVAALALATTISTVSCGGSESPPDTEAATGATATTGDGDASTSDDGSTATVSLPDPCSLLTAEELNQVTGLPFDAGAPTQTPLPDNAVACDWYVDDPYATAQVLIIGDDVLESQRASVEEAFEEPTQDLELADGAYITLEGSLVGMRVDGLFVQVSYIPPGPGDVGAQTEQLARIVFGRL